MHSKDITTCPGCHSGHPSVCQPPFKAIQEISYANYSNFKEFVPLHLHIPRYHASGHILLPVYSNHLSEASDSACYPVPPPPPSFDRSFVFMRTCITISDISATVLAYDSSSSNFQNLTCVWAHMPLTTRALLNVTPIPATKSQIKGRPAHTCTSPEEGFEPATLLRSWRQPLTVLP